MQPKGTMNRIILAFDSFKGSLTSREVADAFAAGLATSAPRCEVCKAVIADGGEGTVEALCDALGGEYVSVAVADPLGRKVMARYAIVDGGATAVMEMAAACGLPLLAPDERNPMKTSTYGLGEMIADAIGRGCRNFYIGIGGSATNDCGMGMLAALGYRFYNADGMLLDGCGAALRAVARIDASQANPLLHACSFTVACDVRNPLYGPDGAACVFAPQKGADEVMVQCLDAGLRHFAGVVRVYNGVELAGVPGGGAAGGLGAAFMALLGAELRPGVDMVLDALHFDAMLRGCDMVVTGEGRIDSQTLMGKAPAGVLRAATRMGVPVVAVGGSVEWCDALRDSGFAAIFASSDASQPLHMAMRRDVAMDNLRRVASAVVDFYERNFKI